MPDNSTEIPLTFTSTQQAVVSSYKRLRDIINQHAKGTQALRMFAQTNQTFTGTINARMVLVDSNNGGRVLAKFDAALTVTTVRTGADGASGGYVCKVVFEETGTSKFDVLGQGNGCQWAVGLSDSALPGGVTEVKIDFVTSAVI